MNDDFQELIEFLDGKFGRIDERLTTLEVGVEGNRTEIRQVGVLVERNEVLIRTVSERVDTVDQKVDHLRSEMKAEFRDHREMLRTSHGGLDRRVTDLERRMDVLEEGR